MKDPIKIIKKCRERNEPTFTVKASDMYSLHVVQGYNVEIQRNCVLNVDFKDEVNNICNEFIDWRYNNKALVKLPD